MAFSSLVKTVALRSATTLSIGAGLYGGYQGHIYAKWTWPNHKTLNPSELSMEFLRHGWIVSSGALMGVTVCLWGPPTFLLVNVQ